MWTTITSDMKQPADYQLRRVTIDWGRREIHQENVSCQDLEDCLGGIGRSFKLLGAYEVINAFAPSSPFIMNLGIFSGTEMMTGLRTFLSAYSPLKVAQNGRPLAMWSTARSRRVRANHALSAVVEWAVLWARNSSWPLSPMPPCRSAPSCPQRCSR